MATSARAQELAEQLLGLEAVRAPLPVQSQKFGGMAEIKAFVQKNKKAITIGAVVIGAVAIFAGYKAYQKKQSGSA